jgi:WD40 repeat protein
MLRHGTSLCHATFSPDGKRIVTASADKTARIWDAANGNQIGESLNVHDDYVVSAVFSPDGKRVVTASSGAARVWDVAMGKSVGELSQDGEVCSAAYSPDGTRIVTATLRKTARVWDVFPDTQTLVSHAKAGIPRCLTPAQRKTFFLPPEPPVWCIEMEKWPYSTAEWKQWLADVRSGKNPPLPAAP